MAVVATVEHAGHEGPDAVDDAEDVDVECPSPFLVRGLPRPASLEDTGVVAQQMHCAESFEDGDRKRLDLIGVSDVGCMGHDRIVETGQRRRRYVTGDHLHAERSGVVDQCPPDATRGAGDDRNLPRGIS